VLDVNGQILCENKLLMEGWKENFKGKLSNHGLLNIKFHMEEFDINVTKKEIRETTYLELRDKIILSTAKQEGQILITTELAIYVTVTEE
jgi:hypothetical protein